MHATGIVSCIHLSSHPDWRRFILKKALAAEQTMPRLRTKKKVTLDDIQLLLLSLPTTIW